MIEFVMNGGLLIHDDTTRHLVESAICLVPVVIYGIVSIRKYFKGM